LHIRHIPKPSLRPPLQSTQRIGHSFASFKESNQGEPGSFSQPQSRLLRFSPPAWVHRR
jgi:hypothetical protein